MPANRPEITVAYITTNIRNVPVEVVLGAADGVRRPSAVNLDSINTIPKGALRQRVCTLSAARMAEVRDAVIAALALQ
jgi:mRNA interferase MazF